MIRPTGVPHTKQGSDSQPLRTSSEALLGSRRELVIEHKGREYRLRVTQNGKLILTA
jgi:hemin uptake protein HemP